MKIVRDYLKGQPVLLAPLAALYGMKFKKYGCSLGLDQTGRKLALRKDVREIHVSFERNHFLTDIAIEFDDFFSAVVPECVGDRLVVDISEPRWHKVPGLDREFLFTFVPETEVSNAAYLEALKVAPGEVVIDAGAYCGLTALRFAQAAGEQGRVVSIEADPVNFAALQQNVENAGFHNVSIINAALWSETSTLKFQAEGTMSSTREGKVSRHDKVVEVRALTLLDICREFNLDRVDHVKMDIEGAEYEVLLSSREFVMKYQPDFIVEVHKIGNMPADIDRLAVFFQSLGYVYEFVEQSQLGIPPLVHFKKGNRNVA